MNDTEKSIKNLSEIVQVSEDDIKNNNKNATAILDLEDIESLKTLLQEFNKLKQDNYRLDRQNQKLFESNINSIPKEKIENKKNKIHDEYIGILSEYGNVDTDITFDIPNKNVRKHLDELVLEIMILQEILED